MAADICEKGKNSLNIVENLFDSQKEFVVLGLCGKTGSGVSTVSNILTKNFEELQLPLPGEESEAKIEETEYRILHNFAERNWKNFYKIKTSSLIVSTAINKDAESFTNYLFSFTKQSENIVVDKLEERIHDIIENSFYSDKPEKMIKIEFDDISDKIDIENEAEVFNREIKNHITNSSIQKNGDKYYFETTVSNINALFFKYKELRLSKSGFESFLIYYILYKYIYHILPEICSKFWYDLNHEIKLNLKTNALQDMGNKLRITKNNPLSDCEFTKDGYCGIAELINISIKLLRDYKSKKTELMKKQNSEIKESVLTEERRAFIVIDSIKNPFESMYLKKRYSNYYLLAVYTDEKCRKERLEHNYHLELKDIQSIDITEQLSAFKKIQKDYKAWQKAYGETAKNITSKLLKGNADSETEPKTPADTSDEEKEKQNHAEKELIDDVLKGCEKILYLVNGMSKLNADSTYPFIMQNVEDCIESADIFINNEDDSNSYLKLKKKMLRYVSLIMYPGLVLPTDVERCMQIANTAKSCSGCISRQVGSVITDNEFNLKSIGWNQQPKDQVPCLYRDLNELSNHYNPKAYSDYENDDKDKFQIDVKKAVEEYYGTTDCILKEKGRSISYCFKDIYNEITNNKNQVHTRALHAEETAFLNLNSTGINGIKDGYLFTTSSPCELCSKKAMYMGISKIFYIQPYPGISNNHVLSAGSVDGRPEKELFTGAIGRAYTQLYTPLLPKKDELELWMGHKVSTKDYIKPAKKEEDKNAD